MNELYSKLYKEAEKIKRWKLAVESELKQKERKFQENRKIIEAQRKAIQELQASIVQRVQYVNERESSSWLSVKILFIRLKIAVEVEEIIFNSLWWFKEATWFGIKNLWFYCFERKKFIFCFSK